MTGALIEGGICFLLLFTPLAFGGVESWAQGIFQIVSGVVVAAWAFSMVGARPARPRLSRRGLLALWAPVGLFVLLVLLQLVPVSPGWMRTLSPQTHDLYARTLPGYLDREPFESGALTHWLLEQTGDRIPGLDGVNAATEAALPPLVPSGFPTSSGPMRALSIHPFETRARLTILLCYIGLFAAAAGYYTTKERLARLMAFAVFSAFVVSVFGIIQRLTWSGKLYWVRDVNYLNVFGPFVNRNSYAAFAGTVLPLALCMALAALRKVERGERGALPHLLLWGFASVPIAGGIFLCLSRGGILVFGISLLVVAAMILYYGRRKSEIAVLVTLVLAIGVFLVWIGPEKVVERIGTLSEGQDIPSLSQRIASWGRTLRLFADHALLGTGLGTFRYAFMRHAPPGEGWWTTAHNEYLEVLCDAGLVGGALLVAGLGAYLVLAGRPARFKKRSERYAYVGIVSGLAGLLVHSAVSSNLQVPANGALVAILGGGLLALVARHEPEASEGERGRFGREGE